MNGSTPERDFNFFLGYLAGLATAALTVALFIAATGGL